MKNQSIICLVLGLVPFLLSAQYHDQNFENAHEENDSKFLHLVETISYHVQEQRNIRPIVFYSKAGFRGESFELNRDWSSSGRHDVWDNEIGSIEVPSGVEICLYEHPDFRGRTLIISGDWCVRDNPWWRDRISSVRLVDAFGEDCPHQTGRNRRGHGHRRARGITVYEHPHFDGASKSIVDQWSKRNSDDYWDDRISSVEVPAGYVAILYKHPDFQGRSLTLKGPTSVKLDKDSWNDEVSSIEVFRR